jgi:hypothetical protein
MSEVTAAPGDRGAKRRRSEVAALVAALLLLLGVALGTVSCGDDDLIFPGEIPFTATSAPEATDTPDPDEDDAV